MIHVLKCLASAVRHPAVALLGVGEYRTDFTTSVEDRLLDAYDAGRELAHIATRRRYDASHG
jgi:hypothetical protein